MSQQIIVHEQEDGVTLIEIAQLLWLRRYLLMTFVGVSLILASVYLHVAQYNYTAALTVVPVEKMGGGSRKLGSLAGLASVAGINLPQDQADTYFQLYIEGYKTREVAKVLAADPRILRHIFFTEWSAPAQKFEEPPSLLRGVKNIVKSMLGVPVYAWRKPDAARLHEYLKDHVKIVQDKKASLAMIRYNNPDPAFAAYFIKSLHNAVDNQVRMRAKKRAEESVAFLARQLQSVTLAEHREALAQSLSEQEKIRMLANSKLAFAAEPLEDPVVSIRPTSPRAVLVLGIALFAGLFLAFLFIFFKFHWDHALSGKSLN